MEGGRWEKAYKNRDLRGNVHIASIPLRVILGVRNLDRWVGMRRRKEQGQGFSLRIKLRLAGWGSCPPKLR